MFVSWWWGKSNKTTLEREDKIENPICEQINKNKKVT